MSRCDRCKDIIIDTIGWNGFPVICPRLVVLADLPCFYRTGHNHNRKKAFRESLGL
jgi:hypothetical protein